MIDWDRVRIFHAVAKAGSFTKGAEILGISQSAISRQIGALEEDLGVALFHRHARGLILTEQGEILEATSKEVAKKMASVESQLSESKLKPSGHLRVNATVGVGSVWLTSHLGEFLETYPEITVSVVVTDNDLDLSMREADVAIRLHRPTQGDLIQRRLMTVHTHIYGSKDYLERHGEPKSVGDLDAHQLIAYGEQFSPPVASLNWVLTVGDEQDGHAHEGARRPALLVNNVYGMLRAVESGMGLASLPDYLGYSSTRIKRVLADVEGPTFTAYFVYPEELRASKRVSAFRDFLLKKVADQPVW